MKILEIELSLVLAHRAKAWPQSHVPSPSFFHSNTARWYFGFTPVCFLCLSLEKGMRREFRVILVGVFVWFGFCLTFRLPSHWFALPRLW